MKIAEKVKEFFHHEGIHSTTIQPEFIEKDDYCNSYSGSDGISASLNVDAKDCCALDCPTTDESSCVKATCCQNNNKVIYFKTSPHPHNLMLSLSLSLNVKGFRWRPNINNLLLYEIESFTNLNGPQHVTDPNRIISTQAIHSSSNESSQV